MASLIEIKSKIQSTSDTKKTTRALELVAASRMKYFQKKALAARSYAHTLVDNLGALEKDFDHLPFAQKRDGNKKLFVLITSDKGLCGSLNSQLIKKLFTSEDWKKSTNPLLITIGKKAAEAARHHNITPHKSFQSIGEDITPHSSFSIIDSIIDVWGMDDISEVVLISPHYVSPFESHVTFKTFLPFSTEMAQSHLKWYQDVKDEETVQVRKNTGVYFEPSREELVDQLAAQLVHILFVEAFYELKASEYSSRMVAMKKATDAATEMLDDLNLSYNKARQGVITQQLAELVGATESMN